jgi:hypothetical protein
MCQRVSKFDNTLDIHVERLPVPIADLTTHRGADATIREFKPAPKARRCLEERRRAFRVRRSRCSERNEIENALNMLAAREL